MFGRWLRYPATPTPSTHTAYTLIYCDTQAVSLHHLNCHRPDPERPVSSETSSKSAVEHHCSSASYIITLLRKQRSESPEVPAQHAATSGLQGITCYLSLLALTDNPRHQVNITLVPFCPKKLWLTLSIESTHSVYVMISTAGWTKITHITQCMQNFCQGTAQAILA